MVRPRFALFSFAPFPLFGRAGMSAREVYLSCNLRDTGLSLRTVSTRQPDVNFKRRPSCRSVPVAALRRLTYPAQP